MDGTLIQSDLLLESTALLLRNKPWMALALPFWTFQGRAVVKRRIAERVHLAAETLPYNEEVVRWLREEKAKGRRLVLATAAEKHLAAGVADYVALFDDVLGSDGVNNLKGTKKLDALLAHYGAEFDYAGDSSADLPIWRVCRQAILVNPSRRTLREATESARIGRVFEMPRRTAPLILQELRVQRSAKNLLIFVPLIAFRRLDHLDLWYRAAIAFLAFSLLASSLYIVNDVADLESDRRDAVKRFRPLASGKLSLKYAFLLVPAVIIVAFALTSALLRSAAVGILAIYFVASLVYSLWVNRKSRVAPLMIAGFYLLRIVMGWASTS